jgi:hypothetical protein
MGTDAEHTGITSSFNDFATIRLGEPTVPPVEFLEWRLVARLRSSVRRDRRKIELVDEVVLVGAETGRASDCKAHEIVAIDASGQSNGSNTQVGLAQVLTVTSAIRTSGVA